jgi:hypothetical protein
MPSESDTAVTALLGNCLSGDMQDLKLEVGIFYFSVDPSKFERHGRAHFRFNDRGSFGVLFVIRLKGL